MFYKKGGQYVAKIRKDGKWIHLGGKATAKEAVELYERAKKRFEDESK